MISGSEALTTSTARFACRFTEEQVYRMHQRRGSHYANDERFPSKSRAVRLRWRRKPPVPELAWSEIH